VQQSEQDNHNSESASQASDELTPANSSTRQGEKQEAEEEDI